ncbi:MAG TPA: polysaccharide pyruvyl transferase family protein, partial [Solirubrobacterales bacterium]|nr:polysaccharide pyruvyl transferase family protein [Solirubrobacterales bacterium]
VAIVGVGVDPELPAVAARALRGLLPRARFVGVRDEASARVLRALGGRPAVEPDLATRLRPAAPEAGAAVLARAGLEPGRPIVGLALTALHAEAAGGPDRLVGAVAGAIDRLPDVQFAAFPMSRHPFRPEHDDLWMARRLQVARPRVAIVEALDDPRLALAAFGQLDAAVAMRYHSLVFAGLQGVPIVAFPYAPKCRTWLNDHGLAATLAVPDALAAALHLALDSRAGRRRTETAA